MDTVDATPRVTPLLEVQAQWSGARRAYILAVLCVIATFNMIDRQIITILVQPIKEEFGASDTAMGLLTGLVFAGFYGIASIPIARFADIGTRRTVMALCLGFWSVMTSLGGIAQSFMQLAVTRVGVAIGESGASPTSHSLIADLYPLRRRATVLALFSASSSLGIGLSSVLGGWLSDTFDWRAAFFIVGVPGLLLALVVWLTVAEPPRGLSDSARKDTESASFDEVLRHLWRLHSYRGIVITAALCALSGYGALQWGPTFFVRVHHMTLTQAGLWFGVATISSLVLGNIITGVVSDWAGTRDLRWYMRVAGAGPLLAFPCGLAFIFIPNTSLAFFFYFLFQLTLVTHIPPCNAMAQTLAPLRMRAMASVIVALFQSFVGIGLAPLLVGAANDFLEPHFGAEAVRYSLALIMLGALGGTIAAWLSNIWIKADYARAREAGDA